MDVAINCCPDCMGEGKIWDFSDDEEPNYDYCDLCQGNFTINN